MINFFKNLNLNDPKTKNILLPIFLQVLSNEFALLREILANDKYEMFKTAEDVHEVCPKQYSPRLSVETQNLGYKLFKTAVFASLSGEEDLFEATHFHLCRMLDMSITGKADTKTLGFYSWFKAMAFNTGFIFGAASLYHDVCVVLLRGDYYTLMYVKYLNVKGKFETFD